MGDDPPDKTSDRNPVSESTARQIKTPGQSSLVRSSLNHSKPQPRRKVLTKFPVTGATPVQSTRPSNARHHSGFTEARYGNNPNPSPMNMGSMAYALPGHHSQQY